MSNRSLAMIHSSKRKIVVHSLLVCPCSYQAREFMRTSLTERMVLDGVQWQNRIHVADSSWSSDDVDLLVICLDGDGCKLRSGLVKIEEGLTLDTLIAYDSCDLCKMTLMHHLCKVTPFIQSDAFSSTRLLGSSL
ncbi:uncharacterized protein LOC131257454 [Magnolia sinica]|uniref:uncharacterized protein LOC131257454 n=1 Tax=Magnolia sinica TaxID=86752 RepID=UPI00265A94E0|nr:uncharacterized protein LOC131257454 [Magnolia sinica]XP_058114279.1 uncharacterized protein LOC131257454 [Magnolia sinica]